MLFDTAYRELINYLSFGNVDLALSKLPSLRAKDLAENEKFLIKLLEIEIELELGETDIASQLLNQTGVVSLTATQKSLFNIITMLYLIQIGEFSQAESLQSEVNTWVDSLKQREKQEHDRYINLYFYIRGIIETHNLNYNIALQEFGKCLVGFERSNAKKEIGSAQLQMGRIYQKLDNKELAEEFLSQAQQTFNSINYVEGLDIVFNTLIELYQNDETKSFLYEQKKRDLKEQIELKRKLNAQLKIIQSKDREISELNNERIKLEEEVWSLKLLGNASEDNLILSGESLNITSDQDELEDLRKKVVLLESNLQKMEIDLIQTKKNNQQLEVKNNELVSSNQVMLEQEKANKTTFTTLNEEKKELQTLLNKERNTNRSLNKNLQKLENDLMNERNQTQTLKLEVEKLQTEIQNAKKLHDEIINEVQLGHQEEIKYFEKKLEKAQNQPNQQQFAMEDLKRLEELEYTQKTLQDQLSKEKTRSSHLVKEKEALNLKLQNLNDRVNLLSQVLSEREDMINNQNFELAHVQEIRNELRNKITSLETKNLDLSEQINVFKDQDVNTIPSPSLPLSNQNNLPKAKDPPKRQSPKDYPPPDKQIIKAIEELLRENQTITLRQLSMRAGRTPYSCLEALKSYENDNKIEIKYKYHDDMNPEIISKL